MLQSGLNANDPTFASFLISVAGAILAAVIVVALAKSNHRWMARMVPSRWTSAAVLGIAYWLTAVLGLQWAVVNGAGSPVWPAAGVGLAGLLLGGIRLWPAILIARLAAAITTGSD